MLRKIGLEPAALKCGIHEPFSPTVCRRLREKGEEPNVLQNNCSGKHAGMLALAIHLGAPTETYDEPTNPVQLAIGRTISDFTGIPIEDVVVGADGCGVPVFGITVKAMALMYARLISPPEEFDHDIRSACARIAETIRAQALLMSWSNSSGGEMSRAYISAIAFTVIPKTGTPQPSAPTTTSSIGIPVKSEIVRPIAS